MIVVLIMVKIDSLRIETNVRVIDESDVTLSSKWCLLPKNRKCGAVRLSGDRHLAWPKYK